MTSTPMPDASPTDSHSSPPGVNLSGTELINRVGQALHAADGCVRLSEVSQMNAKELSVWIRLCGCMTELCCARYERTQNTADRIEAILDELAAAGVGHAPVDRDDLYSKYEATSPDWFQLDH